MSSTPYFKWNYPDDTLEPYFDIISAFYTQQDNGVFALMNTAANIIIPPSTINWNPFTLTLSWVGSFQIPLMSSGFILNIPFGPDGVNSSVSFQNGSRLIITVPSTSGGAVTANFGLVHGAVSITDGLYTVGFCSGTKFYANFPQVYS
jgi:hypothetical protein